jgi:hypothetical protein
MAAHGPLPVHVVGTDPAPAQRVYPLAEASHGEVVEDRELFEQTLKRVHEVLEITDKIPKVAGRGLDLHQLYRNVTSLGGCLEVINRKLWRVGHHRPNLWHLRK